MSFSQYLFLFQDDAERNTNEMQFHTVGISKTRHQYLRHFLLISILFQQFPSSTVCSETRGSVSAFEERVLLHLCYSEAKITREKPKLSVANSPRPAPDANERDVAWCAGCWRSGAATPCSRFASLPGQASWVQPRQRQMCLGHSRVVHLISGMLRFYEWNILWYDMKYLTAFGLPADGSSTVHIYTQIIHRTTQSTQTIHRTTQFTNLEECGPYPVFANYTLAFALQLRKKHGKPSVIVALGSRLEGDVASFYGRL